VRRRRGLRHLLRRAHHADRRSEVGDRAGLGDRRDLERIEEDGQMAGATATTQDADNEPSSPCETLSAV
jgi:hypothetical protein